MLLERITGLVRGDSDESFEALALEAFRRRYERDATFRDLCDRRGSAPGAVSDWRRIPVLEAASLPTAATPGVDEDSAAAALGRAVIDRSFVPACLEGLGRPPVLALIPSGDEAAEAGTAALAERVLEAWAAPDSAEALAGRRRLEAAKARSFLAARQRDQRPVLILATPGTLAQLLEALERRGLRFRLPPGSRVVASGGAEPHDPDLPARLAATLDVAPDLVVRGYRFAGLRTGFYAGHRRDGEPRSLRPPPWVRVRVLDPDTLAEVASGTAGSVAVLDLASPESGCQVLTGRAGVAAEGGFRLGAL